MRHTNKYEVLDLLDSFHVNHPLIETFTSRLVSEEPALVNVFENSVSTVLPTLRLRSEKESVRFGFIEGLRDLVASLESMPEKTLLVDYAVEFEDVLYRIVFNQDDDFVGLWAMSHVI